MVKVTLKKDKILNNFKTYYQFSSVTFLEQLVAT